MSTKRASAGEGRLGFVDDARGLAVVLMIFWHTVDGWIRPELQRAHPQIADVMRLFGGTAAPTFVMLAGVGAAMKLVGDRARGKAVHVSVRELAMRGLHVVATGYAMRAYMWMVDDRALIRLPAATGYVPIVLGLGALLVGLERAGEGRRKALPLIVGGLVVYALGVARVAVVEPHRAPALLKVDVLQTIGASLTLIALAEPVLGLSRRPLLAVVLGFLVAAPTEWIAARMPGALPLPIASYLGQWNDPVGRHLAAFPLFPWLGFALVGVSIGNVWTRATSVERADVVVLGFGAFAAAVAVLAYGPHAQTAIGGAMTRLANGDRSTSVQVLAAFAKSVFMLYRIGFALSLLIVVHLFTRATGRAPLRELGKTSMVVYWVHLEFAYGLCAKPIKHSFGYLQWALGFALLVLTMVGVAKLRLRAPGWLETLRAAREATRAGSS